MVTARTRPRPATVDDYLAAQPAPARAVLGRVRAILRKALHGIPALKLHKRILVYFAGWTQHYSLYPATEEVAAAFKDRLARYRVSKGTLRFPLAEPVPERLIARVAKVRAGMIAPRAKAKTAPHPARRRRAGARRSELR
jgi:uncharacterized protein YdhG (YjbR/CyaY superfamily)